MLGTVKQGLWRQPNGCEEWRRWYWQGLVRRSMIHTRQSPSVLYCGIFRLQNIFYCICIRYNFVLLAVFFSPMFWVSHLINQNNATTSYIIRNYFTILQDISTHSSKTCTLKRLSINVSVLPSIAPLSPHYPCVDITFVCVHLHKWNWPASWSSGQSLWLLIMRSRVRFPVLPWEFSLKGRIPAVTMVWVG